MLLLPSGSEAASTGEIRCNSCSRFVIVSPDGGDDDEGACNGLTVPSPALFAAVVSRCRFCDGEASADSIVAF